MPCNVRLRMLGGSKCKFLALQFGQWRDWMRLTLMRRTLCGAHYAAHIMRRTLCCSHYTAHIIRRTLCGAHYAAHIMRHKLRISVGGCNTGLKCSLNCHQFDRYCEALPIKMNTLLNYAWHTVMMIKTNRGEGVGHVLRQGGEGWLCSNTPK